MMTHWTTLEVLGEERLFPQPTSMTSKDTNMYLKVQKKSVRAVHMMVNIVVFDMQISRLFACRTTMSETARLRAPSLHLT
jgi:hypothetical protein